MMLSTVNIVASVAVALVAHELGHLFAAQACKVGVTEAGLGWGPKVCGVRVKGVSCQIRALPLGAFVRMDMQELQRRPLVQQLFVLQAGIVVNIVLGLIAWGSFFGTLNLVLALVNSFPLYQQDGWKSGMVIFRKMFGRPSPLVEWSFTISAGLLGLLAFGALLFLS